MFRLSKRLRIDVECDNLTRCVNVGYCNKSRYARRSRGAPGLWKRSSWRAKAFGFEAAKERFDPGIIITVTLSAHALKDSKGSQLLAYRLARILATPIGVENQTAGSLTQKKAILESGFNQFGRQSVS